MTAVMTTVITVKATTDGGNNGNCKLVPLSTTVRVLQLSTTTTTITMHARHGGVLRLPWALSLAMIMCLKLMGAPLTWHAPSFFMMLHDRVSFDAESIFITSVASTTCRTNSQFVSFGLTSSPWLLAGAP